MLSGSTLRTLISLRCLDEKNGRSHRGSRGIGRGIAEELASMVYDLLLVAKDPLRLKKSASEIASKKKFM